MSGHSKWATTKHQKAAKDAKRGKLFAKLIKNIEVAARTGGGDPDGNPTLYDAIQKARKNSVPIDNIDRAVKRGSGAEAGGADWQTIMYEGYGPNGVALLIECLTDNRNRAAMEVRTAMTRNGGSMADPGSVSYLFNRKGVVIVIPEAGRDSAEDDILTAVLDAGAEEVNNLGEAFEVISEATDLVPVRSALQDAEDRLRLGRDVVPADGLGAAGRGRRPQGAPAGRRARRPRRRPERLRQLRRQRRDPRGGRRRVAPLGVSPRCRPTKRSWAGACERQYVRVVAARLDAAGRGGGDARPQVARDRREPVRGAAVDAQRDAGQPVLPAEDRGARRSRRRRRTPRPTLW